MQTNRQIVLLCWTLITFGVAVPRARGEGLGEPPLGPGRVTVASQRTFSGEVDRRTDETRLWLRWSHGAIAVLRPIDWGRVVQAEFGDGTYTADELRKAVVRPKAPAPEAVPPDPGQARIIRVYAGDRGESGRGELFAAQTTGVGRGQAGRVRSLALDASVGNWDSDVEVDGLLVRLYPLDGAGEVVPVRGTLEVTLIGWETGRTNSRQPPARLARWTRSVDPGEMGPFGIEYRLPFQAVHPEFDPHWAPVGTVHARLAAPGQGVFDATVSTVRIRPYSALRDHWEYVSGGRFFPEERTGRGRR
jgi:hypothetical protein